MVGIQGDGRIETLIESVAVAKEKEKGKHHDEKIGQKQKGVFGEVRPLRQQKRTHHFSTFEYGRFELAAVRQDQAPEQFLADPTDNRELRNRMAELPQFSLPK